MISLTKHNELKGYKSLDAYPEVAHFVTTRHGGISTGAYGSFNCSPYTNDSCVNVNRNQNWLFQCMNHQIKELFIPEQSHGCASLIINESFFKESLERRRLLQMIREMLGPMQAITSSPCVPNFWVMLSITWLTICFTVPFHPAWTAATTCCFLSYSNTGTQSAVVTQTQYPGTFVIKASIPRRSSRLLSND